MSFDLLFSNIVLKQYTCMGECKKLLEQAKNYQNKQVSITINELLYYKRVYPRNFNKINELRNKLKDLAKC